MILTELCAELNNYFLTHKDSDIHPGKYSIVNGELILPDDMVANGQHIRIVGSRLNDGVYQHPATGLSDEEFNGAIWVMSIPPSFLALAEEIEGWIDTVGIKMASGPYTSESFAGYSYSKAVGRNGGAYTWQDQFATRLNPYRRLPVL